MEGKEISLDALNKAKEVLDGIIKGEGSEPITGAVDESGVIGKSEGAEAATSDVNLEAKEFAKSVYTEGMSSDSLIENCIRKGYSLTVSQGAAEAVIAAAQAAKEGGNVTVVSTDNLVKSEDLKAFGDDLVKSVQDAIGKPFNDTISKGFGAVNELISGQNQATELLKGQLNEVLGRIEQLEKTPVPGKAMIGAAAVNRFSKSEEQTELNGAGNVRTVSISDKLQKAKLVDEMFEEFEKSNRVDIGDAITMFESTGFLENGMQSKFNVRLVS